MKIDFASRQLRNCSRKTLCFDTPVEIFLKQNSNDSKGNISLLLNSPFV